MSWGTLESYNFGPFRISLSERVLWREDRIVPLSPKCFDTLLVLAEHGGTVVEKERLMRAVWPDSFVEEGNLSQNIFTLRKTLGELPGGGQYIQTIPKRGYRLVLPSAVSPAAVGTLDAAAAQRAAHGGSRRVFSIIAAGIFVVSIPIAARWAWPLRERAGAGARITLLTVPNSLLYGIISPDGKHIAYVSPDAKGQTLWVRETAGVGAGTRLFPPLQGHFWGVSYSPDGEYLYYVFEDEKQAADGTLFRISARGGAAQRLVAGISGPPVFTPDGARMAYKHYEPNGRGDLLTATALGADVKVIAQSDASYAFYTCQWAADGRSIYYVEGTRSLQGRRWSLWELPIAGGPARLVMPPQPRTLRSVNWLSRSEVLALIPDEDSRMAQIWRVSAGGAFRRLTNGINNYSQIGLTADARTLLATSLETHDSIWTASAAGKAWSEPVRMSLPAGSYNYPLWTPDGHVLFAGQSNLWLSTIDGQQRKPLIPDKVTVFEPAVSADGRFVVFVLQGQGSWNLWRVGTDGANFRQVTGGPEDWTPALSPDGKWVAYTSRVPGRRTIWKAPLDGAGSPVKLVDSEGDNIVISPDNQRFAYISALEELEVRSFDDGSLVRRFTPPAAPDNLQWSRDGKALTYSCHSGGSVQFWSQPIAVGTPVRIWEPLPDDVLHVNSSRDASRMVYLRREIKVDLALITNLR